MQFNIENPWWKAAVVLGLLSVCGLVHVFSPAKTRDENARWLVETLDSATIAIALVLLVIQPFILQAFYIPSSSMENTLQISDRLVVSRLIYRLKAPKFQDILVFKAPDSAGAEPGTDFIKRCIGTPGDVIEMRAGKLFRNGRAVNEPYSLWNGPEAIYDMKVVGGAVYARDYYAPGQPGAWSRNRVLVPEADQREITLAAPGKVPAGYLLMLGDHRSNSHDGHDWGFAPRSSVVGKALLVFWPPTRFGLLDK